MLADLVHNHLKEGMDKSEVQALLGSPIEINMFDDFNEGYLCGKDFDGWVAEVWLLIAYRHDVVERVYVRRGG